MNDFLHRHFEIETMAAVIGSGLAFLIVIAQSVGVWEDISWGQLSVDLVAIGLAFLFPSPLQQRWPWR